MSLEPLSSNVVNYLVWRYLQEAGYADAAIHLSNCWIRDPDAVLPFAKNVGRQALVRMLQDGITFDSLQAEMTGTRNYDFGRDHGRPYSARNSTQLTLDEGIPAHQLAEEANGAVQEPAPRKNVKRKKAKTNGVEPRATPQVNGDAMEIETTLNGTAHTNNSVRAESEPAASEAGSPSVAELPISTLSIGQDAHIQTDKIQDLARSTTFIPDLAADGNKLVEHISWNASEAPLLLVAGKSMLRLHAIPPTPSTDAIEHYDLSLPSSRFEITALCWNTGTEVTVSAREENVSDTGEEMMMDKLIRITEAGDSHKVISSSAGLINTLRWNQQKELLLSISSDGDKGSIKVWNNTIDTVPAWSDLTDTAILDALWISDFEFVVCGARLFQVYEVKDSLVRQRTLETGVDWDIVKFDQASGIIAALGTVDEQKSYLGVLHPNDPNNLQIQPCPDDYQLMDLDFRPAPPTTNGVSSTVFGQDVALLATCSISGIVRIWDANEPFKCRKKLCTADETQAFKTAFSPDGTLLAAAGPEAVTVWETRKGEVPIASWRAKDFADDKWNASSGHDLNLAWDSNGSRLSIALGTQVAIIPIAR